MKIIIAGCGKTGTTIINSLVAEGHDVTAIDTNPALISAIYNSSDIMTVCGSASDCDTLAEARVGEAELFAAVTGSDELNMLSCFIAGRMGARHTIARIRNPEYNDKSLSFLKQSLDLNSSVNPERAAAQEIYNMLKLPGAVNIETFSRRNFEMIELKLKNDSALDGMKLMDVRKKYDAKFLVTVVQRDDEVYIPGGNFELKSGDKIGITAEQSEVAKLFGMLGIMQKRARSVMILGASRTAYYLAKLLVAGGNNVKIIEKDEDRCREFASQFGDDVVMICGDGAKQELLLEEGIDGTDAFVALTGIDEQNILLSIFASSRKVPKVIAKVNRSEFGVLAENLGIESMVSPQKIVSDIVTRYARALENSMGSSVETLYKLMDGKVEALEFSVGDSFEYQDIPLRQLTLKPGILIGGIIRGRKPLIPGGDDRILPGDKVIVIAAGKIVRDLADIMAE